MSVVLMKLYVQRGETVYGPLSVERLQQLAAAGKLKMTDQVRKEGDDRWYPATKVRGLKWRSEQQTIVEAAEPEDTVGDTAEQAETIIGGAPEDQPTLDHAPGRDGEVPTPTHDRVSLPGYEILGELGRGGMGVVYQARQLRLKRLVALKMILAGAHSGQEEMARFQTEAEAVAQMAHPNIVSIYEVGEHDGLPYFSLEYVDGGSLESLLQSQPMSEREAAETVLTLAEAMESAHEKGIVHRDLKPANVLMTRDGELKISDFGLAKRVEVESGHTQTGTILGTPSYMAPEQASGDTKQMGPRTDVYALGAILYRIVTGRPPFQAENPLDTVLEVVNTDPVPPRRSNAKLPADLETICLKCLEKDPARRYASAAALAEDLRHFLQDEPITARPAGRVYRVWRRVRRNRTIAMLSAAALLVAIISGYASWQLYVRSDNAVTEAAGVRKALQRVQAESHVQQLAIVPFRNQSGATDDEWIGPAFSSDLESKLSGRDTLKVVSAATVQSALDALAIDAGATLDDNAVQRLGTRLVVDHLLIGDIQRLGDRIQVSVKVINVGTGVIDRGGLQVRGRFPDDVFDLQDGLAKDCLVALEIEALEEERPQVRTMFVAEENTQAVDAWVLYGQGKHALQTRELDEAIRLLSAAVEKDPSLWKAQRALGWAYHRSVRFEEATRAFENALKFKPDDLTSKAMYNLLSGRISEGFELLEQANTDGVRDIELFKAAVTHRLRKPARTATLEVVKDIEAAVESHPRDHELLELLAWAYQLTGQEDRVEATLQRAVALSPKAYEPHLRLYLHYERTGQRDQAQREYQLALDRKPAGARGCREFGLIFLSLGRPELGVEELQRALELDPTHGFTYALLGGAYGDRDLPRALEMFQKAAEFEPDSMMVVSGLCRLSNILQRSELLLQYARRWTKMDPKSYEAHQYLRIAHLKLDQTDEAARQAKLLESLTPSHASFFFWSGNSLIQAQQFDEAVLLLRRGHEQFPDEPGIEALLYLGQALQLMIDGRYADAVSLVERSGELMPELPDVPAMLAQCYLRLGRDDEAVEQAKRMIELGRHSVQLRRIAYALLGRLNRVDEALNVIKGGIEQATTLSQQHELYREMISIHRRAGRGEKAKSIVADMSPNTVDEWMLKLLLGRWFSRLEVGSGAMTENDRRQFLKGLFAGAAGPQEDVARAFATSLESEQNWMIVGPFPGGANSEGLKQVHGPEQGFRADANYDGTHGAIRWQPARVPLGDYLDLRKRLGRDQQVVAYARAQLRSPRDQNVVFYLGSDDGVKIWLNESPVYERQIYRGCIEGEDHFKGQLREGINELLIKVDQGSADWGFAIEAVDEEGRPAELQW